MGMNADDERLLRKNWTFLKQELRVEDFINRFVDHEIFTTSQRNEILNPLPNTHSMRCEKFLQAIIASGQRGFLAFCNFLKDNSDNRYSRVIDVLELNSPPGSRPSTGLSSVSSRDGETGERKNPHTALMQRNNGSGPSTFSQPLSNPQPVSAPIAAVAPVVAAPQPTQASSAVASPRNNPIVTPRNNQVVTPRNAPVVTPRNTPVVTPRTAFPPNATGSVTRQSSTGEPSITSPRSIDQQPVQLPEPVPEHHLDTESVISSVSSSSSNASVEAASNLIMRREGTISVDMQTLEQELVRMAPTIADLFQKITKQTRNLPTSEEDIQKVKEENERLRKTNKSLIEKLNMFQQKIIQLQLDNKKLRDYGDSEKMKKDELKRKAYELQEMERRLEEHKKALEEKEVELNLQLLKLKDIEEENAVQKEKIEMLREMQDEGIEERNIQQEQISTLVEEKEKQKDQIEHLEEKHKMGEQRLFRLEERLKFLEQGGNQARRQRRSTRVVSPPRNSYWMNGIVDRSHHANVKYQMNPDIKYNTDPKSTTGSSSSSSSRKGWPFV